jgi:hypothetical protein
MHPTGFPVYEDRRAAQEPVPAQARFLVFPGVPEEDPANGILVATGDDIRTPRPFIKEALRDLPGLLISDHRASASQSGGQG